MKKGKLRKRVPEHGASVTGRAVECVSNHAKAKAFSYPNSMSRSPRPFETAEMVCKFRVQVPTRLNRYCISRAQMKYDSE